MSLATDILRRADINLVATPRQRKQTKRGKILIAPRPRKTLPKPVVHTPSAHEHIPGVSFDTHHGQWKAQFYDGEHNISLGYHPSQARAVMARRIYMFWRKRGMVDIPNKTSKRWFSSQNYPKSITANT